MNLKVILGVIASVLFLLIVFMGYAIFDIQDKKDVKITLPNVLTEGEHFEERDDATFYVLDRNNGTYQLKEDFLYNAINLFTFNPENIESKMKTLSDISFKKIKNQINKFSKQSKEKGITQYFRFNHFYFKNVENEKFYTFEGFLTRTIEKDGKKLYIYKNVPYNVNFKPVIRGGKLYVEDLNTVIGVEKTDIEIPEFHFQFKQNGDI